MTTREHIESLYTLVCERMEARIESETHGSPDYHALSIALSVVSDAVAEYVGDLND